MVRRFDGWGGGLRRPRGHPIRILAIEALRGQTLAGPNVTDSEITPVDQIKAIRVLETVKEGSTIWRAGAD